MNQDVDGVFLETGRQEDGKTGAQQQQYLYGDPSDPREQRVPQFNLQITQHVVVAAGHFITAIGEHNRPKCAVSAARRTNDFPRARHTAERDA